MNKERLQDIKKKYNYERLGEFIDVKPVNTYELRWLIQQAELVQELEELVEGYKIELMIKDNAKKRARQQNKQYRKALEVIYELAEYNEYDNTLEQIVLEVEKALEGSE